MDWKAQYPAEKQPTLEQVSEQIDSPLWEQLRGHLEETYRVSP